MPDRLSRLAPLTGVIFAVLTVVAIFAGGETPNGDASAQKVISYYSKHRSEVEASSILTVFAFLFVVFWAGTLRSYMRRAPAAEGPSALVLAGGVLLAVGAAILSGAEYGLAHQIHHLGPESAKALNVVSNELFLPILIGGCVFGLSSGIAILRGAPLPKWLGWVALVIGIATLIPPTAFPALFAFLVWSLIVSILIYQRTRPTAASASESIPPNGG